MSATKPEPSTAPARASANSMNRRPVRPVAKASGANTAVSVSVIAITAKPISLMPLIAAGTRGMPCSTLRKMFSSTTIASSTTRPIASTIASSVSVLTVKPNAYINANAPTSDRGIVTSGIKVARTSRRKMKITSITRSTASVIVRNTDWIERSMNTDESYTTVIFMPSGSVGLIFAISARTACDSSSGLPVACLTTPMVIDGWPLKRAITRSSTAPMATSATSRNRTG